MRLTLTCAFCGATFDRQRSALRPNQRVFCSRACHADGQRTHGLNAAGYRIIRVDGKQVYEHRWVMSQHIGRPLLPYEHVHHINGQKADNRLSNLRLLSKSDHHREHAGPAYSINHAHRLYKSGIGYRKLSDMFGVARQNIRAAFIARGWHIEGRGHVRAT